MKDRLKVGMTIYNEQPRWFDMDYHPQEILKINDDDVEVFEEGYGAAGKHFTVPIKRLREEKMGDQLFIIH